MALAVPDLPPEVELARRLGVPDGGGGRLVRLTQSGEMWLKPGSKPLDFSAEQTIAAADVGFLWRAWFMNGRSVDAGSLIIWSPARPDLRAACSAPCP